jgi:hypothetical protein
MKKTVLGAVTICAGAPLLALGVGTATAGADTSVTSTDTHTTQRTARGGGLAISVGGIPLLETGNSSAVTLGPSLAIAVNNSQAGAFGIGNIAIATNHSEASAAFGFGLLNTAIANNNSIASAGLLTGIGNTSIARDGSTAISESGSFNSLRATHSSSAQVFQGSFNTVRVNGAMLEICGSAWEGAYLPG